MTPEPHMTSPHVSEANHWDCFNFDLIMREALARHARALESTAAAITPEMRTMNYWIAYCAHANAAAALTAAAQVRERAGADEFDRMEEALTSIAAWSKAYPLNVFPEPDFKKAAKLLKAGGITLDAISASNMRHVVEGVGKIAIAALPTRTWGQAEPDSGPDVLGERKGEE